ncbi:MAG: DUF4062 domain-containing protein [Proteobacteria bacterium]|nr:DUF4062 domain-containing protein [Pseudomonadota bacterium]
MVQASRTFRIFVSSTFSDLKEERNALQKKVFPRLRELCMQHGYRFQAIDLRWGVREEASLDQQTMKICTEEIQRCQRVTLRPNFIMLLGDRYGWRPLPYEIPAEEFVEIKRFISDADKELLSYWYKRDENAVPPVYCLQPRTGEFTHYEKWEVVEHRLHDILLQSITRMELPAEEWVKYTASATEQEIIQGLKAPKSDEHVFCFFRTVKDLPQDAFAKDFIDLDKIGNLDEDANAKLKDLKDKLRSLLHGNIYEYEAAWADRGLTTDHIDRLCEDVYNSLARIINKEIAKLEEIDPLDKEIADHHAFGKDRAKFFIGRAAILQTMSNYVKGTDKHPLAVFGESGSGKSALMAKAIEILKREQPKAVVISRFIGATPSSTDIRSLLESLCREIYTVFDFDNQKRRRLAEIDGESEEARKKREEIEEEYSIPSDIQKLPLTFHKFLNKIPRNKNLFLFLDSLDQLSDTNNARNLIWLPAELPEHVRLIVSTLTGECLSVLEKKLPATNIVKLDSMHLEEGSALLDAWLKDADRTLQNCQREEVLSKFRNNGLPLYLKLAFEEARRWKSYTEKIELSPDIPGVIRDLFRRLSSDANHGRVMVSRSLGFLAAAKNGLTEDELLDVLSLDEEVFQDFIKRAYHKPPEKRLPVIVWSRLYFDLEPYLTERSADGTSLLAFYHRQFGEVVAEEFLPGESKRKRHDGLARYFDRQLLWIEKEGKKTANLRKVSELPYQQTYGWLWDKIEQTLCNLHFIEAKCMAGMTYDLIEDYDRALDVLPEVQEEKQKEREHQKQVKKYIDNLIAFAQGDIPLLETIPSVELMSDEKLNKDNKIINPTRLVRVRAFSQFVNSESHLLMKFASQPGFCLQQAYNFANSGPIATAVEELIKNKLDGILILKSQYHRPEYNPHPALIKTFESQAVNSVSITADGKHAVSAGRLDIRLWDLIRGECLLILEGHATDTNDGVNSVSVTPDGKLAISGADDKTLRVWDLKKGQCIQILVGHTESVTSVSITPDGKLAISGSRDQTLRVWDIEKGQCIRILEGQSVTSVNITPDGKRAVSGSNKTIRVWDLKNGRCIRTLVGHTESVTSVSITPDGRRAVSAGYDKTLRIWDLNESQCLRTIISQINVYSVAITSDGKYAISGDWDNNIGVWDLENCHCIKLFEGHINGAPSVSITPDGKLAISGSRDQTLRIWDLEKGVTLPVCEGHTDYVKKVSFTPDGMNLISASNDKTLKIWDIASGECIRTLEGHPDEVYPPGVSITPDGKGAISWGKYDGNMNIWNLMNGLCLNKFKLYRHSFKSVIITPDGSRAISMGEDEDFEEDDILRIWDIEKGECLQELMAHDGDIEIICSTPDGKWVISAGDDSTLRIWDLETGRLLNTLIGNPYWITLLDITPDGKLAISGGQSEKTLQVWDITRGKYLRSLVGHTSVVESVCITQDGKLAISGSRDQTLRVWNLRNGECLKTLVGHTDFITSINISPDGKLIISKSLDKTLRVWNLESGDCVGIFEAKGEIISVSEIRASGHFACGTYRGEVILLSISNYPFGPPTVTPVRLWLYGKNETVGCWDDEIKTVCNWCGHRFTINNEILDVISNININLYLDQSPCLELPVKVWDESRLLSECPHCNKPLKFNPFIVDKAIKERY